MSEHLPISEYLKFKYSAPPECCKCGNCQLVPPEAIRAAADEIDRLRKTLSACKGYMLNAKIDLEVGNTPKRTTLNTLDGGIRMVEEALREARS